MGRPNPQDLDDHPVAGTAEFGSSVPVIDIAGLRGGHAGAAVPEISRACREWGFFQVINHGIPAGLIGDVWRHTRRFFSEAREIRESILRTRENPWGYYNNELTKNKRDKKEVFDFTTEGLDSIYGCRNRWPDSIGGFRDTMLAYLQACTDLSLSLLEAFCTGLDLPRDCLRGYFTPEHTGFVRLNHYPVTDPMAGIAAERLPGAGLGVHHHTDAGALTVLLQDSTGGLQVYQNGCWHDIPPVEGALVINTGDMMQVWSNDTYRAATHRVLAMQDAERYSIPFFFNPAADSKITPLPTVITDSKPCAYRTIDWSEFRSKRTDGDYADYGAEVQITHYRL